MYYVVRKISRLEKRIICPNVKTKTFFKKNQKYLIHILIFFFFTNSKKGCVCPYFDYGKRVCFSIFLSCPTPPSPSPSPPPLTSPAPLSPPHPTQSTPNPLPQSPRTLTPIICEPSACMYTAPALKPNHENPFRQRERQGGGVRTEGWAVEGRGGGYGKGNVGVVGGE